MAKIRRKVTLVVWVVGQDEADGAEKINSWIVENTVSRYHTGNDECEGCNQVHLVSFQQTGY